MIKAIIFDCFGVLYTDGKSQIIAACSEDKRQEMDDLFVQSDYGIISNEEFTVQASELLGVNQAVFAEMNDGLYHRNEPLVRQMKEYKKQYKIGLLSNVRANMLDALFTPKEQAELFDTVVLSSQAGMVKPSLEIYLLTAVRLGVEPEECVMIDDLEKNVAGAEVAGMAGILYTSEPQLHKDLGSLLVNDVAP